MHLKKIRIFVCFLVLNLPIQTTIAQYSHYIQNYSLSEYKAANQNWDITQAADGKLYIANNDGLLEFDGIIWNFWELPNKTTIRSVLEFENKIYVGSYEEFGYFLRNSKGILEYTSLLNLDSKEDHSNDEAFWEILTFQGEIVFRSFSNIYIYDGSKISSFKLASVIMSCDVVDDKLYVSTLDKGIFVMENHHFKPFFNSKEFENVKVISICRYNPTQLLINTDLEGSFLLENGKLTSWKSEINNVLKTHQLNRFAQLPNGDCVFGTIKNGIYITNHSGKIIHNLNKELGLLNNTILGQFVTKENQLWLGMDNGISTIDLNSPNYFYNDGTGKLGAVYDVIRFNSSIYIGSNTGLYKVDKQDKIEFIEGSQGQVWSLQEIEGDLLCCHNTGTYQVKEDKMEYIPNTIGAYIIKKVPGKENIYLQGTYAGINRLVKSNGKWAARNLGETTIPIKYLVFENENTAWIGHAYKGLYRVGFNKDFSKIQSFIDYGKKGLYTDYSVRIYDLKNTIVFHTSQGWQKYEPLIDSILAFDLLNENISKNSYIISEDDITETVFKTENSLNFSSVLNDFNTISIPRKYYFRRNISGNENVSKIDDSTFALNLYDGFMFINTSNFTNSEMVSMPRIEKIIVNNEAVEIANPTIKLPFRKNSIKIVITSSILNDHRFEYKISGPILNTSWLELEKGILELSNLSDGKYTLLFQTLGNNKSTSAELPLEFEVNPPWFRSSIGFVLYGFLFLIMTSFMYVLHRRKILKAQKLLQLKYEESNKNILEAQTRENERTLIEIRNDALKKEIELKSKQLANTAIALVKKNETLLRIKNDLNFIQKNSNADFSIKKIMRQIDYSIEHEDEWDIFESNFNHVHEEFFNELKRKFPDLTRKDLKMCAFLKMNLSTKEIAPLLNISVRGIETHRYRLKRKLNLDKDENLVAFFQNLR